MSDDFPIVIFHNPACAMSRTVLAMVRAAGYEPAIVDYREAGWSHDRLRELAQEAGLTFRQLLRERESAELEPGLLADSATQDQILDAMVRLPILVNRPLVVTPKGVKLCRPSETVFDLLDRKPESFTKESGEVIYPGV